MRSLHISHVKATSYQIFLNSCWDGIRLWGAIAQIRKALRVRNRYFYPKSIGSGYEHGVRYVANMEPREGVSILT